MRRPPRAQSMQPVAAIRPAFPGLTGKLTGHWLPSVPAQADGHVREIMNNRQLLMVRLSLLDYVHQCQQSPQNLCSFGANLERNMDHLRNRLDKNSHDMFWRSCCFCAQSRFSPTPIPTAKTPNAPTRQPCQREDVAEVSSYFP